MLEEGELKIQVLYPSNKIDNPSRNPNFDSAVILLSFKNVSFLLTGDAPKEVEKVIPDGLQADVLKLGHHRSHTSSDPSFLKKVQPKDKIFYIVISASSKDGAAGRRYKHPHPETMETLHELKNIKLYRTDLHGSVVFSTDGEIIQVEGSNKKEIPEEDLWQP